MLIVFKKYPWGAWALALVFWLCSLYMVYHFSLGPEYGVLFGNKHEPEPWVYFIAALIFILSLTFTYAGKVETLKIDR